MNLRILPLLAGGLALAACNDGTLTLSVADAPIDRARVVNIQFTGVELTHENGDREDFTFDPARNLDLLQLDRGNAAVLLDDVRIPEGTYQSLRLKVRAGTNASDSFVDLETGGRRALNLPSGNESGLTLTQSFVIEERETLRLTVDFDLRRSLLEPAGGAEPFVLKPTLRLVDDDRVGAIAGSVSPQLLPVGCDAAVYVYQGHDVEPDDVGSPQTPLASALVEQALNGGFDYRVAWLNPGDYTAAFTCEADEDDPETDDDVAFAGDTGNVTVSEDRTATFNFQ